MGIAAFRADDRKLLIVFPGALQKPDKMFHGVAVLDLPGGFPEMLQRPGLNLLQQVKRIPVVLVKGCPVDLRHLTQFCYGNLLHVLFP